MKIGLNSIFLRNVLSLFASLLIRLIGRTWRIQWGQLDNLDRAREMSGQVIFSFWHGRLLPLSYSHRNMSIQVLASEHPDGDLMGRTIEWLGFGHIKGSTTRGGARALRELSKVLNNKLDVGLTVDGPGGPRGEVKQGVIEASRFTSTAILPVTNSAKPRKIFESWDRFQIPLPFAKVIISYGKPFIVPDNSSIDERQELRLRLQDKLKRLTNELDVSFGYTGLEVWPHGDI